VKVSEGVVADALRSIPFFVKAKENEMDLLIETSEFMSLKRFEVLFHKGDINNHVYYVCNGMLKVSTHANHGKEVIRSICHPGMLLGAVSLTGVSAHTAMAQALDRQTHVVKMDTKVVRSIMSVNADVALKIFDYVGARLSKYEVRLESIISEDARTRVIKFLRDNANLYGNKVGFNELLLKHNFTQQDIADFTGTSRQTVTTILNDLKRSNIIAMNRRRILIRNVEELV